MAIEASLDSLDRASLAELKALTNPPDHVQLAMSAVLILLADSPEVPKDLSWAAATKMMVDVDAFLIKLRDCGQAMEADEALVAAVEQRFGGAPVFDGYDYAQVHLRKDVSDVGGLLTTWAICVCKGARIRRSVDPQRTELHNTQQKLDRLNRELDSLRVRLAEFDALLTECIRAVDQLEQAAEPEPD